MAGGFWNGSISFGLLNIPVSLRTAEQGEEIHFSQLDKKNHARIRYKRVNSETGREVPYDQIVKGYEYEKNRFVIVTDQDLKSANPKATQQIEIQDFVALSEIDPMLFEKPYYIVPAKNGEKGYHLLRDALAKAGKVAVAKVVLRTKQHLAAVMAKGDYLVLELMRFAHEVIEVGDADYLEGAEKGAGYSKRELQMAEALMRDMSARWKPEKYRDTYYLDLKKKLERKIRGGEGESIGSTDSPRAQGPRRGEVLDLLPLLQKSLEAAKNVKPKRRNRAG